MNKNKITRRGLMASLAALAGGSLFGRKADAAILTPRATEGPFYPTPAMRMSDIDNDLVKVSGLVKKAGGEVMMLKGIITDKDGNPRPGLRIEIWQCDMNGKYLHSGDNRDMIYDQGFQGFGHDITGDDGSYSFRTIKPGKYPGRTPHIHVKVLDGERELLTTQFYVANEPDNLRDGLYRRMSEEEAKSVSMVYVEADQGIETIVNVTV